MQKPYFYIAKNPFLKLENIHLPHPHRLFITQTYGIEHSARHFYQFIAPVPSTKTTNFWICKILRIAMLTVETHNTISGKFVDMGTINRALRLLVDCEQGNEHSVENSHSPTKWVANILLYRLFSIVILFVRC